MKSFVIIFLTPLVFTFSLYSYLQHKNCFNPDSLTRVQAAEEISRHLTQTYNRIKKITPFVPISDSWFMYNLHFEFNEKSAFFVDNYLTATSSRQSIFVPLTIQIPLLTGTSSLSEARSYRIIKNIRLEEIPNLIADYNFDDFNKTKLLRGNLVEDMPICITTSLQKIFFIPIYLLFIFFILAILIAIREIYCFSTKDFSTYFRDE